MVECPPGLADGQAASQKGSLTRTAGSTGSGSCTMSLRAKETPTQRPEYDRLDPEVSGGSVAQIGLCLPTQQGLRGLPPPMASELPVRQGGMQCLKGRPLVSGTLALWP
ncbi:hypothetical protein NDU88_003446 [Pleurodeles waltl]|uniref:Uncharacterized protein n=1 Tax=Pleurodeles waltl TaxID=8319 RepID=A0AAV7UCH6_PLEWA|nr:hypothetical protein NDU88_003446 [Pleurodeles waltl]